MSHHKEIISTSKAPAAIGPYSQAVVSHGSVFVSGQLAIDPESGAMIEGGIREQTRRALENLKAVLYAAGCGLDDVVACTVYLKDMNDFAEMNEIYAQFFRDAPPSRAAVEVARLPKDGKVEISCIAALP